MLKYLHFNYFFDFAQVFQFDKAETKLNLMRANKAKKFLN